MSVLGHQTLALLFVALLLAACTRYRPGSSALAEPGCPPKPSTPLYFAPRDSLSPVPALVGEIRVTGPTAYRLVSRVFLDSINSAPAIVDSLLRFRFSSVLPGRHILLTRTLGYHPRDDTLPAAWPRDSMIIITVDPQLLDGPCGGYGVPVKVPRRPELSAAAASLPNTALQQAGAHRATVIVSLGVNALVRNERWRMFSTAPAAERQVR